jgi:DNA-binding response OmpR family regulator
MPEDAVRSGLEAVLAKAGYSTNAIQSARNLSGLLAETPYDLVVLDLHIPEAGQDSIRAVREAAPEASLILLTEPGTSETVLQALRYRAQDVVAMPVAVNRLEQRIRRVLLHRGKHRSMAESKPAAYETGSPPPAAGGIDVDFERRLIEWDDHSVPLTGSEARLLQIFFENPGRVLGHAEIVRILYGYAAGESRAAGVTRPLISRLRRKLEPVPGGKTWIQSVRGVGYIYEPAKHLQD